MNVNMIYNILTGPIKKKMAIRDYFAIFLRSVIIKGNQKTTAIDCIVIYFFEDREDRSRVLLDEMKWDCNFFLYLSCLWSDLQTVFRKMMGIHS